jgi:hypothetical protein
MRILSSMVIGDSFLTVVLRGKRLGSVKGFS